jgi:alpha-glucosidase
MRKSILTSTFLLCAILAIQAQRIKIQSPDKNISVEIRAGENLSYSVNFGDKNIILPSALGFQFVNEPLLGNDVIVTDSTRKVVNEKWTPVVSKHKEITDNCNEVQLQLEERKFPQRKFTIYFRVYNDGVAFRYFLPMQHGFSNREITRELTSYRFVQNHDAWMANYGSYTTSQETEFGPGEIGDLNEKSIIGLPLLVKVEDICYAAITEANIEDWAGFYIGGKASSVPGVTLQTKLAPRPKQDENGVKVRISSDHFSPWRVILLGKEPGRLVESEIVMNLNEPCAIKDVSWIKPGKCAWDHWWSGEVKMDTETLKKYILFASDMGFPYQLIDWQWYGPFNQPNSDITKVNPAVDMPEVLRFAKEKNVRCWLWLYNTDAERQYKEAFALYEKWGIAGIKIDFMDRDDQEMVNWYHKIVKAAADHHLLVNFHGAYKPDGMQRTYPNFLTREGVMGNEYAKWSTRVTPEHNITLAFTRMLAGPMDYTPGGFLNRSPANFKIGTPANVMNTRCHELAKFVVYDSPVMTVCDHPDNYYNQPGIEFLKNVPVQWDDTRILAGEVGKFIVSARKSGNDWYIGVMNNSESREISLPLDFLATGNFIASLYSDAPEADVNAEKLVHETLNVDKSKLIKIKMVPGGGFVAHIKNQ